MGTVPIVAVVVVVALVVVIGGVLVGVLSARRARSGPAVPDPHTRQETVAGFPVRVSTPPFVERQWLTGPAGGYWSRPGGVVDARLTGQLDRPALTVLPRHRPDDSFQGGFLPAHTSAAANAAIMAFATRGTAEQPTGDAAFDTRYRVTVEAGADPERVRQVLSDPLRAVLLEHDVLHLLLRHDGAWAMVFYSEAGQQGAADRAAAQVLQLVAG